VSKSRSHSMIEDYKMPITELRDGILDVWGRL
jgi:hypothetical protein